MRRSRADRRPKSGPSSCHGFVSASHSSASLYLFVFPFLALLKDFSLALLVVPGGVASIWPVSHGHKHYQHEAESELLNF